MKLIVGLGNPGKKYEKTRHNTGKIVQAMISKFVSREILAKTEAFMNESGRAVKKILDERGVKAADLLIIHDDLDLPLGAYKLQFAKGPHQHNGILSVETVLGTKDFWRLRIGVDSRRKISDQGSVIRGEDYVLQNFTNEEKTAVETLIKEKIVPDIQNWLLKK